MKKIELMKREKKKSEKSVYVQKWEHLEIEDQKNL